MSDRIALMDGFAKPLGEHMIIRDDGYARTRCLNTGQTSVKKRRPCIRDFYDGGMLTKRPGKHSLNTEHRLYSLN